MEIRFATNITQPTNGPITNNPTGVEELEAFMTYLIDKAVIEFMPNSADPTTYQKVILESTNEDNRGVGFKLRERFDLGIPGYFDTGVLKFRVVS